MHLLAALFAILALATLPSPCSAAVWNDKLKVWNIGRVATTHTNHGEYSPYATPAPAAESPSSATSAARSKTEA
ncbi:hypothetical protein Q7P35_003746 [Cladosporium inversicolor]